MSAQIIVEGLVKTFQVVERQPGLLGSLKSLVARRRRLVHAISDVSFSVEAGGLVGYIGPNGAGKSTTVKILSGILLPDSGRVEVLGKTPWKHRKETVRHIGVVFGQRTQLWWDLPVIESFDLLRDIYQIPADQYQSVRNSLVDLLDIGDLLHTPVRQLSLGQRMRCDLAAALLHQPKILYLDEPTIGLDAVSKLAVRDVIRRLNAEFGVTIMLTTHDMDDIEALCRRVIVLDEGRVFLDGTLQQLRERVTSERRLIIDLAQEGVEVIDGAARVIRQEGHRVWLAFDPLEISAAELIARVIASYAISDLYVENPPIEEIIARLYGGPQR